MSDALLLDTACKEFQSPCVSSSIGLSPKVNWCADRRQVKHPSTSTCQVSSDNKASYWYSRGSQFIVTGGNVLVKFLFCSQLRKPKNIANFVHFEKSLLSAFNTVNESLSLRMQTQTKNNPLCPN